MRTFRRRDKYVGALNVYAWRQPDESWAFYLRNAKPGAKLDATADQHIGNLLMGKAQAMAVCELLSKYGTLRSFYTRHNKILEKVIS